MQNIAHHRYYGAIVLTQHPGKLSLQSIHKPTVSHGYYSLDFLHLFFIMILFSFFSLYHC